MNQASSQERQLIWAFWLAAVLAAIGGVIPTAIGGTSSRVAGVIIPFGVAAVALVLCAILHSAGRAVTSALYFVAGLALVFGILSMFALPLEQAVLGTCPAPPQPCTSGLQRPLTVAENTGTGFGTGFAIAAILIGFLGLVVVYRRPVLPPPAPPVRQIPPITPAASPKPAAPEDGATPPPDEPELPAHVEEERPELPPHESDPPTT